jgi:uncharacterized integral membrane protein
MRCIDFVSPNGIAVDHVSVDRPNQCSIAFLMLTDLASLIKLFSTRSLVSIVCVLIILLALKATGAALDFDWLKALAG